MNREEHLLESVKRHHTVLFRSSIFLKCSSRVTRVRAYCIARAATQISFSGIGLPFLSNRCLMRPYSLLVPMPQTRTVLTAEKFSMRVAFSFGREDLKAPKNSSPITVDGINISFALAICF